MDKKLVGERIKKIRQKLGESQEEFGKRFNPSVSKAAVSRWENVGMFLLITLFTELLRKDLLKHWKK